MASGAPVPLTMQPVSSAHACTQTSGNEYTALMLVVYVKVTAHDQPFFLGGGGDRVPHPTKHNIHEWEGIAHFKHERYF